MAAQEDKSKRYEKIEFLGEGQFATVWKSRDICSNNKIVAVKKIKIGAKTEAADGVNRTAIREIKLLQELYHRNIIGLLDVFGHRSNVSLVFDFMDFDLENVIRDSNIILTMAHIKAYIVQVFQGLEYLHAHFILHRDMKPNNLLINTDGVLKIADFGLARFYGSPSRAYTHQVVTRWYRSPELLYGAKNYGCGVDIWATGCILAELLLRVPFLPGESDLDQLVKIFQVLGTPTEETWPGAKELSDFIAFNPCPGVALRVCFSAATDDVIDLLRSTLTLDPLKRGKAAQALTMPFFSNMPAPTSGSLLPRPMSAAAKASEVAANNHRSLKRKQANGTNPGLAKKLQF